MTITEAFQLYDANVLLPDKSVKTRKNYHSTFNSLLRAIGDIPVEILGEDQVALWKISMGHDHNSDTHKRGNLTCLIQFLKWLRKRGFNVLDPEIVRDKRPERDTEPKIPLTPYEVERLVAAGKNPRDKAIIAGIFLTCCRISEFLNIERKIYEDAVIDKRGLKMVWVLGKGGVWGKVYFSRTAQECIDRYLETRNDPFPDLFISERRRKISADRVRQILEEAAFAAGLSKHVTPHILRHSNITDLAENGAEMQFVQQIARHKHMSTTADIYTHVRDEPVRTTLLNFQTPIKVA